jgi:hypothetical protein
MRSLTRSPLFVAITLAFILLSSSRQSADAQRLGWKLKNPPSEPYAYRAEAGADTHLLGDQLSLNMLSSIITLRPWKLSAPFSDPRTNTGVEGAAASLIGNKIYVTHGLRGSDSLLASVYDIPTNTWTHGG